MAGACFSTGARARKLHFAEVFPRKGGRGASRSPRGRIAKGPVLCTLGGMWKRTIFLALVAALAVAALAADGTMRASKPEVKREIVAVIEAQLTAFRKNDPAKAYRLAAAVLRAQKPLAVFTAIVRENYPEIWANVRAEPGIVRDDGVRATVAVQVYSKNEDAAYDYTLVKEAAGWRITGVVRRAPKPGGKI